jgi:hypothetical protein
MCIGSYCSKNHIQRTGSDVCIGSPVKNKSSDLSGTIDLTGQRLGLQIGVGKEQVVSCACLRELILGFIV